MWIRSQNGILLTKETNIIRIEKNERKIPIGEEEKGKYDTNEIIENHFVGMAPYYVKKTYWYILCNKCPVAQYSSEEKALKVLDMIQKHIDSGGRMFVTEQTKTDFGMSAVYEKKLGVFQMPKDEEV